jgi:hypothetical protein
MLRSNLDDIPQARAIMAFKQLILDLEGNVLAPFLRPIIYALVSERISITQKDLHKMRYLLTVVLSQDFGEYKILHTFFQELEIFLDFHPMGVGERLSVQWNKVKIFSANMIIGALSLAGLFWYAPLGMFIGCFILAFSWFRMWFLPFQGTIRWNLGLQSFATGMVMISGFLWLTNLDQTRQDLGHITKTVSVLSTESIPRIAGRMGVSNPVEFVASIRDLLRPPVGSGSAGMNDGK